MSERPMPDSAELRKSFSGNSYASKSAKSDADISEESQKVHKKRVNNVAKGVAVKKSPVQKLFKSLIADSITSVKERALNDVIIPGIKNVLYDAITDMADAVLFGNSGYSSSDNYRKGRYSSKKKPDKTSYDSYYERKSKRGKKSKSSMLDYNLEPDDILVKTRRKATEALNELNECIHEYGYASIADLYDAVDLTSDWTDNQYGWYDIRGAKIRSVRDGFMIVMPPTEELED